VSIIDAIDWKTVLMNVSPAEVPKFSDALCGEASRAHSAGDADAFEAWRILARLFTGRLYEIPPSPKERGANSSKPQDRYPWNLSKDEVDCAVYIFDKWDDPEFIAHMGDLIWILRRDASAAKKAALAYLRSAERLFDPDYWTACDLRFRRSMELASAVDRKGETFSEVERSIEAAVQRMECRDPLFLTLKLVTVLDDHSSAKRVQFANVLEVRGRATTTIEPVNHEIGSIYFEAAAKLFTKLSLSEDADRCWKAAGEELAHHANSLREISGMRPAASYWLGNAIKTMRRASNTQVRCDELHLLMLEWQEEDVRCQVPLMVPYEMPESTRQKLATVAGTSFVHAVWNLALMSGPISKEVLHSAAQRDATSPTFSMFPPAWTRGDGKLDERASGVPYGSPLPDATLKQLMHDRSRLLWQVRASEVNIAIQIIQENYEANGYDLAWLVVDNPFIPKPRRTSFKRGLEAGFTLDLQLAINILVPQLENSLRYLLSQANIVTSRLDDDDTQDEHLLNHLLSHPKLIELLGADMVFDLQGLLIERPGANIRNLQAHGMLDDSRFFGADCLYLWWLILHICVVLRYKGTVRTQVQDDSDKLDNSVDESASGK